MPPASIDLALTLAPRTCRPALAALFALDARLGQTLASTREPMVGQLRIAWWRDALIALDTAAPPAEPVLANLADRVVATGITGRDLAAMTVGWEALLSAERIDAATLATHAEERGARLFALAARLLGADESAVTADAGRGWALADLTRHVSSADAVALADAGATTAFDRAFAARWPARLRPLGVAAMIAANERAGADRSAGGWRAAASFLRFRMTGRR